MRLGFDRRDMTSERAAAKKDDGRKRPNFIFYTANVHDHFPRLWGARQWEGVHHSDVPMNSKMVTHLRASGILMDWVTSRPLIFSAQSTATRTVRQQFAPPSIPSKVETHLNGRVNRNGLRLPLPAEPFGISPRVPSLRTGWSVVRPGPCLCLVSCPPPMWIFSERISVISVKATTL